MKSAVAVTGTILFAACSPVEFSDTSDPISSGSTVVDPGSGLTLEVADAPSSTEACTTHRMVGLRLGSACQSAPGWTAGNLFGHSPAPALESYCLYEWVSGGPPDTNALPFDAGRPWTSWLVPDCNVVAPLGHPMESLVAGDLRDAFYSQVDRLATLPVGSLPPSQVRVDVIDTTATRRHPDGGPSWGAYNHGRTVGLVVRQLACPGISGPCNRTQVTSTLGLPLEAAPANRNTAGGYFGSLSDLAMAIESAVDDARSRGMPLVLNLSLGWDPGWGGDPALSMEPAMAAVYDALRYASCEGAVVVAAAGNRSFGQHETSGPTYPGGWETVAAPSPGVCSAFRLSPGTAPTGGVYRPLVHSVAALNGVDGTLYNARDGGLPRLAAAGSHVTVDDYVSGAHSEVLTGSSLAAAAVSGVVAAVWSYLPALSGHEVMDLVYASATRIAGASDYCLGAVCPDRHRVSLCAAVTQACAAAPLRCAAPPMPACSNHPVGSDRSPVSSGLAAGLSVPMSATYDASLLAVTTTVASVCDATVRTLATPSSAVVCPVDQFNTQNQTPYVNPQPGVPVCPSCWIMTSGTTYLGVNDKLGDDIIKPTLILVTTAGKEIVVDLSGYASKLSPGDTLKVTGLDAIVDIDDLKSASFGGLMATKEYAVEGAIVIGR